MLCCVDGCILFNWLLNLLNRFVFCWASWSPCRSSFYCVVFLLPLRTSICCTFIWIILRLRWQNLFRIAFEVDIVISQRRIIRIDMPLLAWFPHFRLWNVSAWLCVIVCDQVNVWYAVVICPWSTYVLTEIDLLLALIVV